MYSRILVPLDGSRRGSRALKHAIAIASRFDATLELVRVIAPAQVPTASVGVPGTIDVYGMAVDAAESDHDARERQARSYLNSSRRRAEAAGVKASVHILTGDSARRLQDLARGLNVDLIVMASRGRGGLRRAVLGSVADALVRSGVAPVLVLNR